MDVGFSPMQIPVFFCPVNLEIDTNLPFINFAALGVTLTDWLLLQTSADTVLDNESFDIRCYGWKNWSLHKVIYYKNDLAFKYFYESPTISIRNAKLNDSGTYHCTGYLRRLNYTSEKFRITVIKVYKSKYHWLQLIVPLLVVILFAVDTWLLVSTEKQFKLVLKIQKTGKHNKP
ncbi:High affinity immunoglobulin epsilon receptor subunit alpha [Cricetulus griseus]|nr:High affinity immunoglobulin epsilon receptor subunit alpha [Cricetulus griseus]ERE73337.1 high affinity immunoglobulin epsilon receptor subunit alpha-like protein [Cricetulus griseus]